MEYKCEYCGSLLTGKEKTCPACGGPVSFTPVQNGREDSGASGKPKTIAELREFARKHGLPLKQMRVFIGEDCREPKAFGVCQESENSFLVYKNKADGSRAVRYRGPDEAFAVGELYDKMHDMVKQQKAFKTSTGTAVSASSGKAGRSGVGVFTGWFRSLPKPVKWGIVLLLVLFLYAAIFGRTKRQGYYQYNGDYYYQQDGSWYFFGDSGWTPVGVDPELDDNYDEYYAPGGYSGSYGIQDFSQSDYYVEPEHNNHDYDYDDDDDDWDWGGGDWDDIGDWDSDW